MTTEVIDESPRASHRREAGCDIAQELVPFLKDEDDSQFEPDPEARAFFFGWGLIFASTVRH